MKKLTVIILSLILSSCFNNKKEEKIDLEKKVTNSSRIGRQNFVVVWDWTTDNVKLINDHSVAQVKQLKSMWKNELIKNLYYNGDSKVENLSNFPSISFFIKAKEERDVKKILNEMIFVKNDIAAYTVYPVGTRWLTRNTNKVVKKGVSKQFIVIWTTFDANPSDMVLKAQSEAVLELWEEGLIENVYFFTDGTQGETSKTDFMFFINSSSEMEAETILDKLPFVENEIASYRLKPVGAFWK